MTDAPMSAQAAQAPRTAPTARTAADRMRVVCAAALAMGVAGDLLLRDGDPPRLGVALWLVVVVIAAIVAISAGHRASESGAPEASTRERTLLLVALLLAGAALVLRDDPRLFAIDFLSILGIGALLAWDTDGVRLARFRIDDSVRATFAAVRTALTGAPGVLRAALTTDEDAGALSARRARRRDFAVGAVLAVPPLLIAASLLGSADPVLGEWFARWTDLISEDTIEHLLVISVIGWASAGWLRSLTSDALQAVPAADPLRANTAFARLAPSLYGLSALLAIFLGLQARVLFGGAAYLAATAGLTVAEYARSGFFDLVAVTAVVLGVLLIADRVIDQGDDAGTRHFRTAGVLLLVLVTVLIASAVARMALYVSYFGLTTDRLYALFAMLGIAVLLGWFGWTVLRGQRARFGPGLVVATGAWVLLLNIAAPEAIVVRVNVARAVQGHPFDVAYHRKLSADALPALYDALRVLPVVSCVQLREELLIELRVARFAPRVWQEWNLPRRWSRVSGPSMDRCGTVAAKP
ncbi:MAG: DUF4173 domain-containing protein [Gemmatimonadota bacterium]|nr:DUF4173 domain-containing protein [Gemmatimonadota bacterium]